MPVPRRRHCSSRRRRGRTHKILTAVQGQGACATPECTGVVLPHRACPVCGTYKTRRFKKAVAEEA